VAEKAAPGDGQSGRSARQHSAVEEGDGLLERRRSKEVAVVDDVTARGRHGGTVGEEAAFSGQESGSEGAEAVVEQDGD
jgi:hypothetical protein